MGPDPIDRPVRKPRPGAGGRRVAVALALTIVAGDLWSWLGWRTAQDALFRRRAVRLDELAAAYRLVGREVGARGNLRLAEEHADHSEGLQRQGASMSLQPWSR